MEALIPIVERFGLPTALVLLFVYLDLRRRKKEDADRDSTIERLVKLEDYQRDKMEKMVVESTTAQQNLAEVNKEVVRASRDTVSTQRQLITALRTRPCLEDTISAIEREGA